VESFEHLCKVALEAEGFVVTSNVKFFVRRLTSKKSREEYQTHGYEVDLVGARSDQLVLAEVKSFFGSRGVNRQSFRGLADESKFTDCISSGPETGMSSPRSCLTSRSLSTAS
jgi:hypothetical protein